MKILISLLALSVLLGCSKTDLRDRVGDNGNSSLTESDYDRIRGINLALSNAESAIATAFPDAVTLSGSDKIMSDMVTELKKCPAPIPRADRRNYMQEIKGGPCPIRYLRRSAYRMSSEARQLSLYSEYEVLSAAYKALNPLHLRIGGGQISFTRGKNGEPNFVGNLEYPGMQVSPLGSVNVKINISSSHVRGESTGSMNIRFKAPAFNYQAVYSWSLQNDTESFYLNGKPVESTEFLQLFSAFDVRGMRSRIMEEF